MAGQPTGSVPPNSPASSASNSVKSRKIFSKASKVMKSRGNVLIPIGLVVVLLFLGLSLPNISRTSGSPQTPNSAGKTSEPSQSSGSGSLNVLIVQSIVQIVAVEDGKGCFFGSGTVVYDGNHVLTNEHVVDSDSDCQVDELQVFTVASAGEIPKFTYRAKVLVSDQKMDLAILKITPVSASSPKMTAIPLFETDLVGQDLTLVGFPAVGGDSVTVSRGILSGFINQSGIQWIKTDAAMSGGNSGGAALDSDGRLVGVPSMFSQTAEGEVVDCRSAADTNGDGEINSKDSCVGIGGTFGLLASMKQTKILAKSINLLFPVQESSTTTTP